uniref:Phosphotransferase n=1 Tax=Kwoniella dejecticola CBS 10117 TaxID=1296121 RepID=A0A1A6A8T4_9TREE|nr:hexokinase [Kwoniella dejecticola CBS 10117]OBR86469.1 hexokinase [Kwoniella dejecticola CBS 10117]
MSSIAESLVNKLNGLNTSDSAPTGQSPSAPASPTSGTPRHGSVLDNGTNIGSALGRKPSVGGTRPSFAMSSNEMERRGSAGSTGRISRRGSNIVMTPSGAQAVYHTRTQDDVELPHAEKSAENDSSILDVVTPQRMRMIVHAFEDTLDNGLQKDGQIVVIPTFVFGWPSGTEVGEYLALDLGGTNLRVCLVTLQGQGKFQVTQTKYRLTEEQKQDEGQKLLDFCAECLDSFIRDTLGRTEEDGLLPLGFTFSYPCSQDKIDHGVLIRWTKGFGAPNIEGRDVAAMFMDSLKRFNVPAELTALINDTTGTLIASNYVDPHTKIAVIFGTGCNAAYMENAGSIPKIDNIGLPKEQGMAINCEWGAFDSFDHQHLPRTKYDIIIDESSNKPGEQSFEKMIAGLYLGEIFRLIICELIDAGDLFLGQNTYKLEKAYAFDTAFLSLMESDVTDELLTVIGVFTHFFGVETTLEERQFFKKLAVLIGTRSARLSACGIAAIVSKKGYLDEGCAVGADGSLYNKYPNFANRVHAALVDIFGEKGKNIVTHHAEDGSGVGSAIIAAMTKARKDEGYFVQY